MISPERLARAALEERGLIGLAFEAAKVDAIKALTDPKTTSDDAYRQSILLQAFEEIDRRLQGHIDTNTIHQSQS